MNRCYNCYNIVKCLVSCFNNSFESKLFLSRLMRSVAGSKMFTVAILTLKKFVLSKHENGLNKPSGNQ